MKAIILNDNLYIRPESPDEVNDVARFKQGLHNSTSSVIVFLGVEPSTRAMSITPNKEQTIN